MTFKKICADSKCEKVFYCNNECGINIQGIERSCFCEDCIKNKDKAHLYKKETLRCPIWRKATGKKVLFLFR